MAYVFLVAQIGFATRVLEAVATSIGAGILVGGFAGAGAGMLAGWSRKTVEGDSLRDGFCGGLLGLACLIADSCLR
jgi:hypothetical protein